MNWVVFGILSYVVLVIQTSLSPLMTVDMGLGSITPDFVLIFAVVLGLFAPAHIAVIVWGVLGLLVDLAMPPVAGGLSIIGPHTLGYLAGVCVLLQLRSMVFRQHPLTAGFLVFMCGLAMELVVVFIFTVRGLYDVTDFWAMSELGTRFAGLVYSGVVGAVLSLPMRRLLPLLGLESIVSGVRRRAYWGRQ